MAQGEFFETMGSPPLTALTLQAPAKINLFLAVTGRRDDGYHDLLSVAAPLVWGDSLEAEEAGEGFALSCDDPEVPLGPENLVLRAAEAFKAASNWGGGARFSLRKKIPMGAGLGGASSDAASALLLLNQIAGSPFDAAGLQAIAAGVGSDCSLFLSGAPVVMRGRGERVERVSREAYARLRGIRVLLFKPGFAVPTPWAYARLAAEAPRGYVAPNRAEAMLEAWLGKTGAGAEELLFNSMERPVFAKFPALPALLQLLYERFGIAGRMSGSGSTCFALLGETTALGPIEATIRDAWGPSALVVDTRVA